MNAYKIKNPATPAQTPIVIIVSHTAVAECFIVSTNVIVLNYLRNKFIMQSACWQKIAMQTNYRQEIDDISFANENR